MGWGGEGGNEARMASGTWKARDSKGGRESREEVHLTCSGYTDEAESRETLKESRQLGLQTDRLQEVQADSREGRPGRARPGHGPSLVQEGTPGP